MNVKVGPFIFVFNKLHSPKGPHLVKEYGLLLHLAFNIETVLTCYGLVILLQTMVE